MIDYFHAFTKSIRTGDLKMYLYSMHAMTNFMFIAGSHPGLEIKLAGGSFDVRRTEKPFSRIPVDLTLKQTINADAARSLTEITHLTNSIQARQRWAMGHGLRSTVISHVLEEANLKQGCEVAAELGESSVITTHEHLQKIY